MTPDQLHSLLDLQKTDLTLLQLKKESQDMPVRKEAAAATATEARNRAAVAKATVSEAESAIKQIELDVESLRERINKYKTQQMEAKSNDAYRAFNNEIASAQESATALEDRELEEMSRLEDAKTALEQANADLAKAEEEVIRLVAELDQRMETIRSTFEDLKSRREPLAAKLDDDILQRYMGMLTKKQEAVVVPIQQESCGGCHMKLSPQILHDAHSGRKWTTCGFCGRMLYDPAI